MDSLAWSKKYDVLSISRLVLREIGFTNEQITSLTDDDMQAIADGIADDLGLLAGGLDQAIAFVTETVLASRSTDVQTGGQDE